MAGRHPHILQKNQAVLLIIDMQEKFAPAIEGFAAIEEKVETLIRGFRILGVPIYYTEQYPKGLGHTTAKIAAHLQDQMPIEKLRFSAADDSLIALFRQHNIKQIVLAGIEAHVCVLQSALDFHHAGFQVHVVADATRSRRLFDFKAACARMQQDGIQLTIVESVLFELLETSGTDEFRSISKLIK